MTAPPVGFLKRFDALSNGTSLGTYRHTRYSVTKSEFNAGKSFKLEGEELGGPDYISLNLYKLETGPRLYPCEMSSEKVIAFVTGFQLDEVLA